MKNIAIVGCGYWGKNLIRNFYELGSLKGIYDIDIEQTKILASQYKDLVVYNELKDVLVDNDIEGVVISIPVEEHLHVALTCLMFDKHIFVEKPMTSNLKEANVLYNLVETSKKICLVGHVMEYHPAIIKLRQIIKNGIIGDVKEIYSHRLNAGKIRQFENVWWSFAPHDVLLFLNTINSDVQYLECIGADYCNRNIFDSTITSFKFANGCFGHIYVSWMHPFKLHRFVVIGTKGAIEFNDSDKDNKLRLYSNKVITENGVGIEKGEYTIIPFDNQEPLKEECKDFIDSIRNNTRPRSSHIEGRKVIEILENAMKCVKKQI